MTELPLLINVAAYSAQVLCIVALGGLLSAVLRVNAPAVRHTYWRALVVVCIALPWIQGRQVPTTDATVVPESVFLLAPADGLRRSASLDAACACAGIVAVVATRGALSAGGRGWASPALAGDRTDTSRSPPLCGTASRPVQQRRRVASGNRSPGFDSPRTRIAATSDIRSAPTGRPPSGVARHMRLRDQAGGAVSRAASCPPW